MKKTLLLAVTLLFTSLCVKATDWMPGAYVHLKVIWNAGLSESDIQKRTYDYRPSSPTFSQKEKAKTWMEENIQIAIDYAMKEAKKELGGGNGMPGPVYKLEVSGTQSFAYFSISYGKGLKFTPESVINSILSACQNWNDGFVSEENGLNSAAVISHILKKAGLSLTYENNCQKLLKALLAHGFQEIAPAMMQPGDIVFWTRNESNVKHCGVIAESDAQAEWLCYDWSISQESLVKRPVKREAQGLSVSKVLRYDIEECATPSN